MRASRARRAHFQPDVWVNLNMRKSICDLSQMHVEPFISAFVPPGRSDFPVGIAEHRTKSMLYSYGVTKFILRRIDARLRDICPHAQYVRKIGNFDYAHGTLLRGNDTISLPDASRNVIDHIKHERADVGPKIERKITSIPRPTMPHRLNRPISTHTTPRVSPRGIITHGPSAAF